ncbi:hypothetical protein [Paenibacillus rigui]|uniref:Uncharacterized protein n=1 Tax=Paenibacillus rigui TaxID=554312 RepID=A0A229UKL3_9BACL|nr:hypothetical protein [Paenibacillus rigui]OXM83997.1 hypothetical protein CF651_23075 [Paenibacillus rigui]
MDINKQIEAKLQKISDVEKERESLFENFEANKNKIGELHYEIEILKLQYMFLKRQQLDAADRTYHIVAENIDSVKSINETCIGLLQKRLIEDGFGERLQQEKLI